MNKKFFLGMFAAAGILLATSCSKHEIIEHGSGDTVTVSFNLTTDGMPMTRAISDGTGAKKLVYAVYDENGKIISTIANADANGQIVDNEAFDNGLTEKVTITLAKDRQYAVAFWAQNPNCTAYTTTDLQNVTVDYVGLNNDETRDAFFNAETFTVTGDTEIDVVLKRPFAQINVGVYQTDWDAAVASGVEIEKSKVTITNAAKAINLLTGEVSGNETVQYSFATIPAQFTTPETLDVDLDKDGTTEKYVYLSMSYILANDETTGYAKTTLENLDFTFAPKNGNSAIKFDQGLTAVPVQRNWRTNIIGKILTGNVAFNISIDPIYDGEYNNGEAQPVNINGVYYANVQDAVNAAKSGDVINLATGTYNEMVSVAGGKNITIEAAGPNVIVAGIGHQSNSSKSTVKVKGVTFDNSLDIDGWFTGTAPGMNPCVGAWGGDLSFENCKFIVAGTSKKETGVMTWWTGDNLVTLSFDNCTFEGKENHSDARAMQIYGKVNLTVENCTFTTANKYTLKYVAENGNVATFSNNIVNNSNNFVQLGSSDYPGANYTANINNNTLGKGVNAYVIANDENQTVNVNGNIAVIAEGLVKDANGNYIASSNNGITSAISDGATEINLAEGNYIIPSSAKGKTLTIKGTGDPEDVNIAVTKVGTGGENCDYGFDGSTVTLEGITITTNSSTYIGYARCNGTYKNCIINGTFTLYGESSFENCTFNVSGDVYNIWTWGAPKATFNKCTFNSDGKALLLYGTANTELTIENSVFNDNGGLTDLKAAIEIGNDYNKSYTLVVNNTVVNGYEINNKGINTNTTLWANKNSMGKDKLSVTVDGKKVY